MVMANLANCAATAVALVCVGLVSQAAAGGHESDGKRAVHLTPSSFDDHLAQKRKQKRKCFVMFHVSWCKVCQRTFPEFANASEKVYERKLPFDFAHVDCTDEKTLCNRYNVKGYPTIKLFSEEESVEPRQYKLQRNEAGFLKYAERMLQPPVRTFSGYSELETALNNETLSAFVVAKPSDGKLPAALEEVATTWMDRHIFASASRLQDLLPEGKSPGDGVQLAVLSIGNQQWSGRNNKSKSIPSVAYYEGSLDDKEALSSWVEKNRFPGIWKLTETIFFEFTHAGRPTAMLAADPADVSPLTEISVRRAMIELSSQFIFGVVDAVGWNEELADFNIYQKDLPRVLVTENNFEVWIEDIDLLRADTMTEDLRSLVNGAPLLRQAHKTWSKILFYHREAMRFVAFLQVYAQKGPAQAMTVIGGCIFVLSVFLLICWGVFKLFSILLSDPGDFEHEIHSRLQKPKTS